MNLFASCYRYDTRCLMPSPFKRDGVRAAETPKPSRMRHSRGRGNPRVAKDVHTCAVALPSTQTRYEAYGSNVACSNRRAGLRQAPQLFGPAPGLFRVCDGPQLEEDMLRMIFR